MLELRQVEIFLRGKPLFAPITTRVAPGEIVSLMGPSGCGKSTLLAHICGALSSVFVANGEILLRGKSLLPVSMEDRGVGILFQDDMLFPHMDVLGNLLFALPVNIRGRRLRQQRALAILEEVGMASMGRAAIGNLSGGERARISLLRTLLAEPRALLLDEPFSALDCELRQNFRNFVKERVLVHSIPTLLVTHDREDVVGKVQILRS